MLPLKHIHQRKTLKASKKYTHATLDSFMYIVAFAGPLMTLPQVYDIWINRIPSVNPITWGSYLIIGCIWLYYGFIHKEKVIIFSNILGLMTTGLVLLGSLIYAS